MKGRKNMGKEKNTDIYFMKEALKQAKKAYELNETPIGCVIVKDNKIISRAYNKRNLLSSTTAHAEILAINKACKKLNDWRLEGCNMYITLEPCPMCAGAILQSRMDKIIIAAMNKKAGCTGSIINLCNMDGFNHKVEVSLLEGDIAKECSTLMSDFFKNLRSKKNNTTDIQ